MPEFPSVSSSQDIVHPTCLKCGVPMWLIRIEPAAERGSETHFFECQACQNETTEVVKSHRWVNGKEFDRFSGM
jgi:hypothetical protein